MSRSLRTRVLVIGGGINGTGVARDLALRGVDCVLVEKRELGSGTTWASSGMIHGGLRYLQTDPEVTRHSCVDSGAIQRIAPHLVFRIPFVMPVFAEDPIGPEIVEIGLEMYDRFVPLKNGRPHTRLTREQALALEPALSPRLECAFTLDEWGVDAARLCVANALDAAAHGARVFTHCEAVELLRESGAGRISGARVRDRIRGEETRIEAELVLNAAGPWGPALAELAGEPLKLRPGKGIHLVFERRVSNVAIYAKGVDGRDMFTFPHEQNSMAGTTDDDYYGDLDRIETREDEVAYVLEAMERSIPGIRAHRVVHAIQGVRPTLYGFGAYEDELSRDYRVIDHGREGQAPGLFTLTGGKLAAYRLMAEDTTDRLCRALGVSAPCRTADSPLPGGESPFDPSAAARRFSVGIAAALRLGFRHGAGAVRVLEGAGPPRTVCACEPVLEPELRHAARAEGLRKLTDCPLRLRLASGTCQGTSCAAFAAQVLADELAWSGARAVREVAELAAARWHDVAPVLVGRPGRPDGAPPRGLLRHERRALGVAVIAVIGGGLAGAAAALALAERGADVVQIAGAPGATALASGALDVAAVSPNVPWLAPRDALRGSVLSPAERLALVLREAPAHPYTRLFGADAERAVRALAAGVERLARWLAPHGVAVAGSLERSQLLVCAPGTLRVGDFATTGPAGGDLEGCDEIAVVDAPGLAGFEARFTARGLEAELAAIGLSQKKVRVLRLAWPAGVLGEEPARVAARLDQPAAGEALARALRGAGGPRTLLLFGPVLGIARSEALCAALRDASGGPVAEVLAFPPHALAGFRLERALRAAVAASRVRAIAGRVRRLRAGRGGAPHQLELETPAGPRSLEARALVLATGRFTGGGLSAHGEVREPLLGLPLHDAEGRRLDGVPAHRAVRKGYASWQPLYSAGVRVDAALRPLGPDGAPAAERVFCAGELIGGFDPARERTGLGVALATGLAAAERALEAAA